MRADLKRCRREVELGEREVKMFEKEDVSKSIGGQIRDTIHDVAKSLAADTNGKYQASAKAVREQAERLAELAKKLEEYEA